MCEGHATCHAGHGEVSFKAVVRHAPRSVQAAAGTRASGPTERLPRRRRPSPQQARRHVAPGWGRPPCAVSTHTVCLCDGRLWASSARPLRHSLSPLPPPHVPSRGSVGGRGGHARLRCGGSRGRGALRVWPLRTRGEARPDGTLGSGRHSRASSCPKCWRRSHPVGTVLTSVSSVTEDTEHLVTCLLATWKPF